jgi:hypothetical protein
LLASVRLRRALASTVAVLVLGYGAGHAQQSAQPAEEKLLARPVTPGTVAQLVDYPGSDAAEARLREAITSGEPQVRAAAARVVFVTAHRSLVPNVASALDRETDIDALTEQARALAFFGDGDSSARILAAWQRVPADRALLSIAAARGAGALDYLPLVRERTKSERLLAVYLRLASRRDPDRLTDVARMAIRRVDRTLLAASFRAWDDAHAPVPHDVMADALRSPSALRIADAVCWYLLRRWQETPAERRDALRDEVLAAIDHRDDAQIGLAARVAYELVGRAFDRPARDDEQWLADLARPDAELEQEMSTTPLERLLTDRERTALAHAYEVDRTEFEPSKTITVGRPLEQPSLYVASGYPAGFMRSVLETTNCKPRAFASGEFNASGARITFRGDGRLSEVAVIDTGVPSACVAAARTLIMTFVAPIDVVIPEGTQTLLMVPFAKPFVTCQDSSLGPALGGKGPGRHEPRRSRIVAVLTPKPTYTMETMAARIEGEVRVAATVSPQGCVRSANVVVSLHPQLDWAAAWDVVGFTFKTTGLDADVPVNIELEFNMR